MTQGKMSLWMSRCTRTRAGVVHSQKYLIMCLKEVNFRVVFTDQRVIIEKRQSLKIQWTFLFQIRVRQIVQFNCKWVSPCLSIQTLVIMHDLENVHFVRQIALGLNHSWQGLVYIPFTMGGMGAIILSFEGWWCQGVVYYKVIKQNAKHSWLT